MKVKLSVGFGSCFLLPFIPSALSDERENVVASPNWEMIVFFEEEQRRRRANKGQKAPVSGQTANWPRTVWSIYCLGKEQGTIWRGLTSGEKTLLWAGPTFVLEKLTSWTTTRWSRTWMRRRSWMRCSNNSIWPGGHIVPPLSYICVYLCKYAFERIEKA